MRITSKDVKDFWKYMARKYKFEIVHKSDSASMKIIGWALSQMGIQSKDAFLKRYTTTVCLGSWRAVYIPFEIGRGTQAQLISQVETCVHEAQHVVQAGRDSFQPMKYLRSDTSRAFYEADAYRTNMEMHWYFTGKLLSAKRLAGLLRGYRVGKADRRIAEKHLIIASKVVKRGGVISGVSKNAIRWWNRRKKTTKVRRLTLIRV